MTYNEKIQARQESNLTIADLLKDTSLNVDGLIDRFAGYAKVYPQQRAGQIICNYIADDYRSAKPSEFSKNLISTLFPGDPDPFFEESVDTLERIKVAVDTGLIK